MDPIVRRELERALEQARAELQDERDGIERLEREKVTRMRFRVVAADRVSALERALEGKSGPGYFDDPNAEGNG